MKTVDETRNCQKVYYRMKSLKCNQKCSNSLEAFRPQFYDSLCFLIINASLTSKTFKLCSLSRIIVFSLIWNTLKWLLLMLLVSTLNILQCGSNGFKMTNVYKLHFVRTCFPPHRRVPLSSHVKCDPFYQHNTIYILSKQTSKQFTTDLRMAFCF